MCLLLLSKMSKGSWKSQENGKIENSSNDNFAKNVKKLSKNQALAVLALGPRLDLLKDLIKSGASVNSRGEDGTPALHSAAFQGQFNILLLRMVPM